MTRARCKRGTDRPGWPIPAAEAAGNRAGVLPLGRSWRSCRSRGWLVLAATLAATLSGGRPGVATTGDGLVTLGAASDTLLVEDAVVCLAHGFVDAARLEVTAGPLHLESPRDYRLDAAAGCLHLFPPERWQGEVLVARYVHLPFALRTRYARRDPVIAATTAAGDSVIASSRREVGVSSPEPGAGLRIRGYKTFAVKLGSNRDPSLNQALDLDVAGEIASGVELRALLSDRDLPLQPEGNTESLDELDKVLLEVRTRTLSATLGDYEIRAFGGDFLSYSKRLEGVKAEGRAGERAFVLAAAVAKGEFVSLELNGVEGKQGPYLLTDAGGNPDIVVIAGSETVWLDGERLTRGESQDYTIDYGRGELTFTPRRLITRDSRLTVDFEFSTQAYERNFYVGGARSQFLDGSLELGASIVSEADDDGSPIVALTDAERQELASAGDSTQSIAREAGIFVGEGNGDYLAIGIGGGAVRYQYAGDGGGDYRVDFVEVGPGAGDYQDSTTTAGERVYRWVGVAGGAYQPVRELSAPEARRLADLSAAYRPGDRLAITGELAISGLDLNTLSSRDDFDNGGAAARLGLEIAPLGDWPGGGPRFRAGYREVGATFRPLGRIRPADYTYAWNAPAGAFDEDELRRDLGLDWALPGGVRLGGDLATVRSSLFRGERRLARAALDRRVRVRVDVERTRGADRTTPGSAGGIEGGAGGSPLATDRRRARESGLLAIRLGRWSPRVSFEREERRARLADETRSGTLFTRYGVASAFDLWSRAELEVALDRRVDRTLTTGAPWSDARRALEQRYRVEVARWRGVSASGSFTRRSTRTVATGTDQVADLVQVDLAQSALEGGLESEFHYDATTTDVSADGRQLVFVGEGLGAYDAFGRFVGGGGDYNLVRVEGAQQDLRTQLRLDARAELRPRRIWRSASRWWRRALAATGYETTLFVDELTRLPLASPRLFLDPASYQREDATFAGRFRIRQDIELFEALRALAVRLRYERTDEAANRTLAIVDPAGGGDAGGGAGVFEDRGTRASSLRLRSSPRRTLSIEWSGEIGDRFEEERRLDQGSASRFDLRTREQRIELTLRPGRALRLGLDLRDRRERERSGDAEVTSFEWSPNLTLHRDRLRVDGRVRRVAASRQGVFSAAASLGALGSSRTEYLVNVDYRATDRVTLTGGIDGSGVEGRDFIHTARLELRAFF